MKFGQLIEYNKANVFLEISYTKCGRETNFFKEGFELVSLPHFLYEFQKKIFLLLYSLSWPHFNAWLPLPRKIMGNICLVIVF